ncbi:MAG: hypothetical protein H7A41_04715 [Chlamydiales bacterium]|nr:hypothetical protein [Chlamydiales bacterium]
MAETQMRIERINPLPLEPIGKSQVALKKRSRDEEQTAPISRKRTRPEEATLVSRKRQRVEPQEASSVSRKRPREEDTELFPNKKRCMALPEKATENVDFNRNVWTSSKPQSTQTEPMIGTHRALPAPKFERVDQDPLLHVPKVGGYYIAQIVGQAYELHLIVQEKQLEVFKVTHAGVQKLRDDQIELVRDQIKNEQIQAKWSYWSNALEYFGIVANATLGTGVLFSGNVPLGAQMLAGSALSLSGKLLRDFTDHQYKGAALSLTGALVSGYSGLDAGVLDNSLPQKLASSVTTFQKVSEMGLAYHHGKAQTSSFTNKAKQVTNEFKRKTAEKEMEQIVGGLGKKDQTQVIAAAAKTISVESQITGDIARGGKS